jgi:uncharacterized SAM-binding protein YcdF (DUF218 family)
VGSNAVGASSTPRPPGRRAAANALAVVVLASVVLASAGLPLAGLLLRTALSARSTPRAGVDAVVVLGTTLAQDGAVPPLLASRLDRADALYRTAARGGHPPVVVVSGGAAPGDPSTEASAMAAYLRRRGVPAERVLLEDRSTTTQENLRFSAALLAARGPAPRVLVVTSDYHTWRTAALARRGGLHLQVVGAPTPHGLLRRAVLREAALVLGQQDWARAAAGVALAAVARLVAEGPRGRSRPAQAEGTGAGPRPRFSRSVAPS